MVAFLEKPLIRFAVFGMVGFVSFLVASVLAFPDDQVKAIIEVQIEKQLDQKYLVKITDLDLWWLTGVSISGLSIEERTNPNEPEPDPDEPADLPVKITFNEVNARLGLIRSLINLGPTIEFEADVGGGTIEGNFAIASDERRLYVTFDELDLRQTKSLTSFTGVPFFGTVSGDIDVALDPKKAIATSGTVNITGEQLTAGPATVKTDKFPPMTYFEIPQTSFGKLVIDLEVKKDGAASPKLVANTFTAAGRDIRMELWGFIELASHISRSRSQMNMRMQLDEGFVKKNSLGPLLNVNEVRKGSLRDWYGFTLYGSVSKIRLKGSTTAAKGATEPAAKSADKSKDDSKKADAKKPATKKPAAKPAAGAKEE